MNLSQHSRHSCCSTESQPQSIVHQIIRLENQVEKKVKKIFKSKKKCDIKESHATVSTKYSSASASVDHGREEELSTCSLSSFESFFCDDSERFQGPLDASLDVELEFETIDQNTFITQVLMDTLSGANYFIHFFNEDYEHFAFEDQFKKMLIDCSTSKEFGLYRMSSQRAPLFTAKLGINPEKSTLIHVRNGKVLRRLEDLTSVESREQVQEHWLRKAGEDQDFAGVRHPSAL